MPFSSDAPENGTRPPFSAPVLVAVAMGSNVGDRRAHLAYAVDALTIDLTDIKVSSIQETLPLGVGEEHGPYLNAVLVGWTSLSARNLLERMLDIEEERGRARPYPMAPRTLDLDLILYGSAIISEEGLLVPHPRFREREFVMRPLAEIAPDITDPVTGKTMAELDHEVRNG